MAVLAAAALLDELMGRNRNILPNEKAKELNWEDAEYCKYYLVKFCPHDLFVNTRADLGTCPKVHDEEVKKLFEKAKSHRKVQYQEEFIRFASGMIAEVERKIVKGRQRLALNKKTEMAHANPAQVQQNMDQINMLNERINGLEKEAEQAGIDGNVEQAQGLMKLCDQLKEERDTLKKQNENGHWSATAELAAAQEKQMEVCEVCGAFLIVGDAQQRIEDHLMGKQHVGYARLKAAIGEVTDQVKQTQEERRTGRDSRDQEKDRPKSRERDRSERRRDRESEKDKHRKEGEKAHDNRHDREKSSSDRKEKDRKDRDRSERGDRNKERDRERERRDRDRDRRQRDHDRDAGRDRDRNSHHHSRHRR